MGFWFPSKAIRVIRFTLTVAGKLRTGGEVAIVDAEHQRLTVMNSTAGGSTS